MAKRRNFTPEFKAEVVLEALRGESSQAELCRRHNLSEQHFAPLGLMPWEIWRFYKHFAPLGLLV